MSRQSILFNRFLAEVSDLAEAMAALCEKYSALWADTLPYDAALDAGKAPKNKTASIQPAKKERPR